MRYQDTVFGGLMKAFPRWRFEALVKRHEADRRVRRLPSWSQFLAMLYAQLSGARSLREVIAALDRFPGSHAHLGLKPVRRSTLADANRLRPAALFEDVLAALVGQLSRSSGRQGREMLRLIDATRVVVGKRITHWQVDGSVKLHVVYDPGVETPVCLCGDVGPGQRHHACQAVSDRAGRDLCVRQGLLRLRLLGGAGRCGLPLRHPAEEELAAGGLRDPGGDAGRGGAGRPCRPPLAAPGRQPQEPVRQAGPGGHCAHRQRQGDHPSHQRPGRLGPKRSPRSTSSAGRSNCSSNGSSRTSKSNTSSAPARTPCASRYSPP